MTFDEVAGTLLRQDFRAAVTQPWQPHDYTLRENWRGPIPFEDVVRYIYRHGYPEVWGATTYTRLNINDRKYWCMNSSPEETILINRAELSRGPQLYDEVAPGYDSLRFEEDESVFRIIDMISSRGDSVLDVGCGTGRVLDRIPPRRIRYVGFDPSRKMIERFREKHPDAAVFQTTAEEFSLPFKFDLVLLLYAVPNYLPWAQVDRMLRFGKRYVCVFYQQGYAPGIHASRKSHAPRFYHPREGFPEGNQETLSDRFFAVWGDTSK